MADDPDRPSHSEKERVVALLQEEWALISDLLRSLDHDDWSRPALPGWDVHDVVAHLVGGERGLSGAERPTTAAATEIGDHVHNDIARLNEDWVVSLRDSTPAEMLADFDAVTATRSAALETMTEADFDAPSWTPVGQGTYGRFMQVRIFDAWMHEQDIRAATGRPGHESGPIAQESLSEVVGALGYIIAKRGGAPDGTSVTIRLTGPIERDLHVEVDGRAKVVEALDGPPTARIALSSTLFLRLAGGRLDADSVSDQIELSGDVDLARQLAANFAYTI